MNTLAPRTAELCADAVDVLEVAAGLEADGINDATARRHGHADVFALAEHLFSRTHRRPSAAAGAPADPWRAQPWRHLLRGVLFGLPGICYASATPLLVRSAAVALLIACLVVSWTAGQTVAYLGYLLLGRQRPEAAKAILRRGIVTAMAVLVPGATAAGLGLGLGPAVTALAVGQCVYLLSATVALVVGAEVQLLYALLPGVAAGVYWTLFGNGPLPAAGWSAWAITLAGTVLVAVLHTRKAEPARVTRAELLAAIPHGLFGMLAAGLLTMPLVAEISGGSADHAITSTVLALSLSMGPAEWILHVFRGRTHELLWNCPDLRSFRIDAFGQLMSAVMGYLAVLTVLVVAVGSAAGLTWSPATTTVVLSQITLGGSLFIALILQSCGRQGVVLAAFGIALAASALGLAAPEPGLVRTGICHVLFLTLLTYGCIVLSRATSHR